MGKAKPNRTIFRDSGTGQLVTEKFAEKHPKTTEKERVYIPPAKPKKKK